MYMDRSATKNGIYYFHILINSFLIQKGIFNITWYPNMITKVNIYSITPLPS